MKKKPTPLIKTKKITTSSSNSNSKTTTSFENRTFTHNNYLSLVNTTALSSSSVNSYQDILEILKNSPKGQIDNKSIRIGIEKLIEDKMLRRVIEPKKLFGDFGVFGNYAILGTLEGQIGFVDLKDGSIDIDQVYLDAHSGGIDLLKISKENQIVASYSKKMKNLKLQR